MTKQAVLGAVLAFGLTNALQPIHSASAQETESLATTAVSSSSTPGTLANPGFEGQPMKGAFFFTGNWREGNLTFYNGPSGQRLKPARNFCKYSTYPAGAFGEGPAGLGWSEHAAHRDWALNNMLQAGVNVVNMSYWGTPNVDRWAFWAPMHTAPKSNEELFAAAVGKPLLIAPFIENSKHTTGLSLEERTVCGTVGPVGQSPAFKFFDDFPGTLENPAPALVEQIVDLLDRFLLNSEHPEWRSKWARMYDRDGKPRYVVSLLHVASNQPNMTDETFAQGFGWVADRVAALRGVHVGFTLDALPEQAFGPEGPRFKPTAAGTGPYLAQQRAVLAILPFTPEIHSNNPDDSRRCKPSGRCDALDAGQDPDPEHPDELSKMIKWKQQFITAWVKTSIPVILDITSGRDAHIIFGPDEPRYGRNPAWRTAQNTMLTSLGVAGAMGIWNAYTEGMTLTGVCAFPWDGSSPEFPSCVSPVTDEHMYRTYRWFTSLVPPGGSPARLPTALVMTAPSGGTYSDPVDVTLNLTKAFTRVPAPGEVAPALSGRTVHVRLGTQEAQGTTDANGNVTISITIDQVPGNDIPLQAAFDGDDAYLSIETLARSIDLARETTVVEWVSPPNPPGLEGHILAARLIDDDGQPVVKRTIALVVEDGTDDQKCTAETDVDGIARCKITGPRSPGRHTLSVDFPGDAYYSPATAATAIDLNLGKAAVSL